MADISTLIHDIEQAVYQNTGQEVTGSAVQLILKEIASTLNTMKVDAVEGKGLSTNDLTDALKSAIENAASQAQLAAGLAGKVDKEAGKGLSTNDLTDAILATIQNAVSASELATALLDYVQKEDGKGLSTNDYTNADKQKVGNALTEVPDTYRTASAQDTIDAGKADKVPGATAGHLAALDSDGNLEDSGKSASDIPSSAKQEAWDAKAGPTPVANAIPAGGMLPNVLYNLGTLTGSVTMTMASAITGVASHWYFTFDTGATAPTITWDAAITSWAGGSAPTISANKHYEVSVLAGVAVAMEI